MRPVVLHALGAAAWRLALVLLLAALSSAPLAAEVGAEAAAPPWAERLERRLGEAGVPASEIGVAVLTLERAPRLVFARGQAQPLVPASVAKVLTAAAALDLLGPAHVFTTRVSARGRLRDGVLEGDLVLHGTGDPSLSGRLSGGAPTVVLDELAAAVAGAGVRQVAGDLVLDDGPFDRAFVHAGWTDADKEKWYGAPVGGLAFNDSCLDITVAPGSGLDAGGRVDLPSTSGAWEVQNLTTTVQGARNVVGAAWSSSGAVLQVRGQVALSAAPYTFHVPVPDPLAFTGAAFRQRLAAAGVRVTGGVRPAGGPEDRAPGRVLAQHGSSLSDALRVMNRQSQNFYAGQLFKASGAALTGEGSWASGQAAVAEMLRRRGLDDGGSTAIVDGSGLARANRTTAGTVALLLASFERDLLRGPVLLDSLAAPGEPGTLDDRLLNRFTKGRLRAKTGTLAQAGVYSMAGVIDARAATRSAPGAPGLVFAVFVNRRTWKGDPRSLIDDLVTLLATP